MPMNDTDRRLAQETRSAAAARLAAIRADKQLSDLGKRQQMAAVYREANERLTAQRQEIQGRDSRRKADLERRLFGLPVDATSGDVITYRDALDRAATIETAAQANDLLSRARGSGDRQLERAVFHRAYEMGGPRATAWNNLVEAYLAARPDLVDDVNELITCSAVDSSFDTSMALRLQVPPEIAGQLDVNGDLKTPAEVA